MLNRFVKAQENTYSTALQEIKSGRKKSHWMWFIFPQLKGLGFSETAQFYGINGLSEAQEYLQHPVLGGRLREISRALLTLESGDAHAIFGYPDDMKLKSSMTLFAEVGNDSVFDEVLMKFFDGEKDQKTLELLKQKM